MSNCLKELNTLIKTFSESINWNDYEIYLFKQKSVEYAKLFNKISTFFVPVFEFEYILNELSSIFNNNSISSYSGIVMTSPRSVHALHKTLSQNNIDSTTYKLPIPIFTFGNKTPKLINQLLPQSQCIVFDANDSNSMSLLLIKYLNDNRKEMQSLLILFGERHRLELTNQLNKYKIKYEQKIVYRTVDVNELCHIKNIDYKNKNCYWIFFSPNGVDVVMKYLKNNKFNINQIKKYIKCGCLGSTTANKLTEIEWNASFIANKPNGQALYSACYNNIIQKQ
eukprot:153690_1